MIGYVKDNYIVCLRFFIISYANLNVPDTDTSNFCCKFCVYTNNTQCINCAACSNFAPTVFERNSEINKHVVYNQPNLDDKEELEEARAALAACPVAAIRVESIDGIEGGKEIKDMLSIKHNQPFPQSIYPMISSEGETVDIGVHYLGHHNDASFGAIPYLCFGKSPDGKDISIMVDVPRFSPSAVRAVKSLAESGPDYMFLTHVDDTADHNKWKEEFPTLKRIFHSGDLGRHNWVGDLTLENVEILLQGDDENDCNTSSDEDRSLFTMWDINGKRRPAEKIQQQLEPGEFLILYTPGHSPGSISLLFRPTTLQQTNDVQCDDLLSVDGKKVCYPNGVLFTGDTYSWTTRDGGHMSGFPRYGNNLQLQATTLQNLGKICHLWDIIAPGHGHPRFYLEKDSRNEIKLEEMRCALEELL